MRLILDLLTVWAIVATLIQTARIVDMRIRRTK